MTDQHRERVTAEDVARMIDEESQGGECSKGARKSRALFFVVDMLFLLAGYVVIDLLLGWIDTIRP